MFIEMIRGGWYHHDRDGWWGLVALLVFVAFWGSLIWLGVWLMRRSDGGRGAGPTGMTAPPPGPPVAPLHPGVPPRPTPKEILDERLARGEIDLDDYRRRLAALTAAEGPPGE